MDIFSNSYTIPVLVLLAISVILRGFLSAAGKDMWEHVKEKTKSLRRIPTEVPNDFKASIYPVSNCTWIPESNIQNKEKQKWKYYPHPKTKGKCYRSIVKGNVIEKEYFMVTPEAKKVS
jgi:hypothetical protein